MGLFHSITPQGDGNFTKSAVINLPFPPFTPLPRKGTETSLKVLREFRFPLLLFHSITPQGDGNP